MRLMVEMFMRLLSTKIKAGMHNRFLGLSSAYSSESSSPEMEMELARLGFGHEYWESWCPEARNMSEVRSHGGTFYQAISIGDGKPSRRNSYKVFEKRAAEVGDQVTRLKMGELSL